MHTSPRIAPFAFVVAGLLAALPAVIRCAHPLAADDTGTVGHRGAELELTLQRAWDAHGGAGAGLAVHVGLGERLDLGLGLTAVASGLAAGDWGFEAPAFDLKWRMLDGQGARPALALRLDYGAPAVGHPHAHELGGVLIATWERPAWLATLNLGGYRAALGDPAAEATWYVASGILAPFARAFEAGVELAAEGGFSGGAPAFTGMAAFAWSPGEGERLSLGVGPFLESNREIGWLATVGLTAAFGS